MAEQNISDLVSNALDEELKSKEEELAVKFGAIPKYELEIPSESEIADVTEKLTEDEPVEMQETVEFPEIAPEKTEIEEKKKTKDDLIKCILELQSTLGVNEFMETKLRREKKVVLETILAGLYNRTSEKVIKLDENRERASKMECESIVYNLYMMNVMMASLLEKGSELIKEKTYDINLLEGMAGQITNTREELLEILKKIYSEHKIVLDKLISPTSLYLMYLTKTIGVTAGNNLEKKRHIWKNPSETK